LHELANELEYAEERKRNGADGNGVYERLRPVLAEQPVERGAQQGQRHDDPEMIEYWHSLELEQVHALDVQRLAVVSDHDDDGQAHGRFGGRHHDDEENENHAVKLVVRAGKGHEREIHGVEHQLNGHEDGDDVALKHHTHHAEAEQNGAQHQ